MENFLKIKEIIVNALGCSADSVTELANVKDDLGADSLAVVELVMAIEDAYEISISEDEMKSIVTVGDIVKLVESK